MELKVYDLDVGFPYLEAAEGLKGQTVRFFNGDLIWVQIGESQIGFSLRLNCSFK